MQANQIPIQMQMKTKKQPLYERTAFLTGITFIGGFVNAYGYCARDGILLNNHTGNMSRLGINLAMDDWAAVGAVLVPIAAQDGAPV